MQAVRLQPAARQADKGMARHAAAQQSAALDKLRTSALCSFISLSRSSGGGEGVTRQMDLTPRSIIFTRFSRRLQGRHTAAGRQGQVCSQRPDLLPPSGVGQAACTPAQRLQAAADEWHSQLLVVVGFDVVLAHIPIIPLPPRATAAGRRGQDRGQ